MFKVKEARPDDAHKGIARMDSTDMAALGLSEGRIVEIRGKKTTVARVRAGDGGGAENAGERFLQIGGM
ncbi:MAG: hypothetical protein FWG71_10365, partial [Synergistaceae bacterium]|nr:hypothetical protein [Synergistaceae bacterium]